MKSLHKLLSFLRYVLWFIFFFIIVSLVIGIIKYKTIGSYIYFLNTRDRNEIKTTISWQNPVSIFSVFWEQTVSTGDVLTSTGTVLITGDVLPETTDILSGDEDTVDPYDPAFQDDFNDSLGGDSDIKIEEEASDILEETGFGFTTTTSNTTTSDGDSDLLKLIKQHDSAE